MEQSIYRVAIYSIWRWPASLLYDNSFILPRCFFSLINSIKGKGSRAKPYNMGCWTSLLMYILTFMQLSSIFPQKNCCHFCFFFLLLFLFLFLPWMYYVWSYLVTVHCIRPGWKRGHLSLFQSAGETMCQMFVTIFHHSFQGM